MLETKDKVNPQRPHRADWSSAGVVNHCRLRRQLQAAEWAGVARVVWGAFAVLVLALFGAGAPAWWQQLRSVCFEPTCLPFAVRAHSVGLPLDALASYFVLLDGIDVLGYLAVSALLIWRKPRDPVALLASFALLLFGGASQSDSVRILVSSGTALSGFVRDLRTVGIAAMGILFCVFPDGRFVPRWTLGASAALAGLAGTGALLPGTWLDMQTWPPHVTLAVATVIFVAQVYRYRYASDPAQRQQTRAVIFGLLLPAVSLWAEFGLPAVLQPDAALRGTTLAVVFEVLLATLVAVGLLVLPACMGIAILRHGLFDIDLIMNRAVIYSLLGAVLACVFIATSTLAQHALEEAIGQRSDLVTIGAGLLVAMAFQPMHRRIKIAVDRFLPARQMLTLVFTDIVGSTERLASEGDARWRELLATYQATIRRELKRYRGFEVNTAGDSFFATFESSPQALACAQAIATGTTKLGIGTRIGLHRGEVEMRGDSVSGLAVHTAARVMSLATAEEILVSSTILDTLRGTDVVFKDCGPHTLKGVPGVWRLYSVSL